MHRVIFWDFDGTLVHSNSLWSRSVYRAIHTIMPGCQIPFASISAHMKTGFTWHTPDRDHTALVGEMWWQHMFDRFSSVYQSLGADPATARLASRTVREIIKSVDSYIVYDDAASVLQACSERGYQNYILSNNYPDLADVIDSLQLRHHFAGLIVSAEVGYDKPRIELFDHAKKVAGYPDRCIMVGDNPVADVRGGQAAGMKTILVHPRMSQIGLDELSQTDPDQDHSDRIHSDQTNLSPVHPARIQSTRLRKSGPDHTFYSLTEILTVI